mmetsp:Transcript_80495/g.227873  ORF Transcript_80495/g.227873 Transcript_80495/m.227873 type:complete len:202 (-) Transcript_80495:536-1141(-)
MSSSGNKLWATGAIHCAATAAGTGLGKIADVTTALLLAEGVGGEAAVQASVSAGHPRLFAAPAVTASSLAASLVRKFRFSSTKPAMRRLRSSTHRRSSVQPGGAPMLISAAVVSAVDIETVEPASAAAAESLLVNPSSGILLSATAPRGVAGATLLVLASDCHRGAGSTMAEGPRDRSKGGLRGVQSPKPGDDSLLSDSCC